ncbi:MAG: hypothetical protein ACSHXK_07420 [Oceanococcus sp.]
MKFIKRLVGCALILALAGAYGYRWLHQIPQAREFTPPAKTAWKPSGPRFTVNAPDYSVTPEPNTFHTMHVGSNNTDNLWIATAPMFEFDWIAEADLYVPEGPTLDDDGNLYFSPVGRWQTLSLVALDGKTGARRWALEHAGEDQGAGGGAPLILNDPAHSGEQIIYHASYEQAMALSTEGETLWRMPTGLILRPREAGKPYADHHWGMNYLPQADALVGVTMDAGVYILDRSTGKPLADPIYLPGRPAPKSDSMPRAGVLAAGDAVAAEAFGDTGDGTGLVTRVVSIIFGSETQIANFFGIDPNNGLIYIAATAPDEQDGKADGVSDNGALYRLEFADGALQVTGRYDFVGGTGSTPSIRPDSQRIMLSDDNGNVIALDSELNELWRYPLGEQIAASIAVADDNAEVYAVTRSIVIKLIDEGDHAREVWRANLDAYPGFDNFNALTPTITANGIAVSVGGGRQIMGAQLMPKAGMGLIDRETGELRYFADGGEESIAVTVVGPDGGFYIGNSPIRRSIARGLLGDVVKPVSGGVQRYKPIRLDLLVRDASCAAQVRANNAVQIQDEYPLAAQEDVRQIRVLLTQALGAVKTGAATEDLSAQEADEMTAVLNETKLQLAASTLALPLAAQTLANICERFE